MESPMTLAEMEGLVVDPTTSAEQLRLIAYFAPDLRAQVIRHPKVYPGLLDWLEDIGDPEIVALVGERRRADSGEPLRPAAVSVDAEATAIIPIQDLPQDEDVAVDRRSIFPAVASQRPESDNTPQKSSVPDAGPTHPGPGDALADLELTYPRPAPVTPESALPVRGPDPVTPDSVLVYPNHPEVVPNPSAVPTPPALPTGPDSTLSYPPVRPPTPNPGLGYPPVGLPAQNPGVAHPPVGPVAPVHSGPTDVPSGPELTYPQRAPMLPDPTLSYPSAASRGPDSTLSYPPVRPPTPNPGLGYPPVGLPAQNPGVAHPPVGPAAPNSGPAHPPVGPTASTRAQTYPPTLRTQAPSASPSPAFAPSSATASFPEFSTPPQKKAAPRDRKTMWILIGLVVALLAILGFIFFDFSSGEGDSTSPNSTDSQTNQTQPTAPEAENKPQQPDTAQSTIVFPAPATAKTMPGFSSPSGNIVCFLSDDQATCKIAQNSWEGTAYQTCRGDEGVGVLSLKGNRAEASCVALDLAQAPVLAYGEYAKNGQIACTSTMDGISCWNQVNGKSFALARGGWMTSSQGEITPDAFTW